MRGYIKLELDRVGIAAEPQPREKPDAGDAGGAFGG